MFKASRGIEDIYELSYIRKKGTRLPAVVSVTALRVGFDVIIGYLLIGTDNTARKPVEQDQDRAVPTMLRFTVTDSGIGIADNKLATVFFSPRQIRRRRAGSVAHALV